MVNDSKSKISKAVSNRQLQMQKSKLLRKRLLKTEERYAKARAKTSVVTRMADSYQAHFWN